MMTFDNYNTSTKDNNGGGGVNTGGSNTAAATSTANHHPHHHHHNLHTHQNPQHNPQLHYQQGLHLQPGGQQQQQQQQQQYFHHYDSQQPFNLPLMQGSSSPTHPLNQTATTGSGSTTSTTPIWNLPFGQQSSTSSYYQPSSSIGASNRRNSLIDSTNIWLTSNPTNTAGASGSNIWATSTNLQPGQQQQSSQMNFPPTLENYISTSSIAAHNRSSLIPGFTSSPPPPAGSAAGSQQVPPQPQISLTEPFSTTPSEISPGLLMDPLMRRRSFTDALSSGGPTPSTTATTTTSAAAAPTTVISDKNTLQMVDDYFENDPHERVKVTLQLLNERFFDEEKFLGDAYQLPKFPIENSLRNYQLILVGFKAGRIDVFYLPTNNPTNPELLNLKVGDLVIVEADRGRDLGKVFKMNISIDEARLLKLLQFQEQQAALNEHVDNILDDISVKSLSDQQQQQAQQQQQGAGTAGSSGGGSSSTTAPPTLHFPKSVIALAQPNEIIQILNKKQDEEKACRLCLAKIANATSGSLLGGPTSPATQDLLQMKLIDAEYQFDRKKLIFYYSTSRRIDFRDLVRELFRIYKTRIWMCAVIGLPYQISSRRNSNSPLLGAPPQPTLTTTTSTTGSATSGSSFINPFMQQQQQPSATTASSTTSIPTTSNSQYNINRLDRRLSFQIPPTYQQQGQAQQQTINYPQQQQGQQGQIPLSYQLDFIPRRFSDSRSQISSTWQQQQPSQQQQYVIPTKYQFPPSQQQGHHHQTTGSISEILQPHSEEHSPGRIMNDENEQDRDGCEEFKDDEIMKQEDKDVDDIEVDEESFSNHSGESFVLKSLVDSINH